MDDMHSSNDDRNVPVVCFCNWWYPLRRNSITWDLLWSSVLNNDTDCLWAFRLEAFWFILQLHVTRKSSRCVPFLRSPGRLCIWYWSSKAAGTKFAVQFKHLLLGSKLLQAHLLGSGWCLRFGLHLEHYSNYEDKACLWDALCWGFFQASSNFKPLSCSKWIMISWGHGRPFSWSTWRRRYFGNVNSHF